MPSSMLIMPTFMPWWQGLLILALQVFSFTRQMPCRCMKNLQRCLSKTEVRQR